MFFNQKSLAFSLVLGLAIIAPEAPLWIMLFTFLILGLRAYFDWREISPWSPKFSLILAFLLLGETLVRLGSIFNQDATISLVLGLTALRIMDYRKDEDKRFLFLLGFIIYSLKPLFTLDIFWLPPCILGFFGLWRSQYEGHAATANRYLLRVFVYSLPITALLFFIFPRVVLPWAKEQATTRGRIGFSESMNPGSLSELVAINEIAFRARFTSDSPKNTRDLYWRGGVLETSNGLKWSSSKHLSDISLLVQKPRMPLDDDLTYDVTLEDFKSNFLFLLDRPINAFTMRRHTEKPGKIYRLDRTPNDRFFYRGVSNINTELSDPPSLTHLETPEIGEKTLAFINSILSREKDLLKRLEALNDFFKLGEFKYSLKPGVYNSNLLDEFLFERKIGFCEHFAGSYATLARKLGIPSRVVIGFHGGNFNAFGQFWEVNSKDAHAWVELFINKQWVRVDPTQWVAPQRIQLGGTAYFQIDSFFSDTFTNESIRESYRLAHQYGLLTMYRKTMDYLDHVNFMWVQFMLNFNLENQYTVFLDDGIIFIFILLAITGFVFWSLSRIRSLRGSLLPTQLHLLRLQKKYSSLGFPRDMSEPPLSYLDRLVAKNKNLTSQQIEGLNQFKALFALQVYANKKINDKELKEIIDVV